MRQPNGLRALEVCVAGKDHLDLLLCAIDEDRSQTEKRATGLGNLVPHPENKVGGHLIVAATAGVELPRYRSDELLEPPLHVHVDVFEGGVQYEGPRLELRFDLPQAVGQLLPLLLRQDLLADQHAHVDPAGAQVLSPELAVEVDGAREAFETVVGALLESAAPGLGRLRHRGPSGARAPGLAEDAAGSRALQGAGNRVGRLPRAGC